MEVARKQGLGYENLLLANPEVDPWNLPDSARILLPRQLILPRNLKLGLTVNLAELRLFHAYSNQGQVQIDVYPLGIGRAGRETPEGLYRVVNRQIAPTWRVPEGLREMDPTLPRMVPPGPDNPLGSHWLGLSAPGYGIHGTNRPLGVGRRISYGCLRMYPEDITDLFPQIPIGTPVQIVYQPVKAGWRSGELLLEVHPDYLGRFSDPFQNALQIISARLGGPAELDYEAIHRAVATPSGIPVPVGSHRSTNGKGERK